MSDRRLRNHRFDTARPAMTPPPHPRRRAWLCRAGLALVLSAGGLPAGAWNARGHAAIAALAEAGLNDAARAQVQALLAQDLDRFGRPSGRRTLAAVASWPDEIRAEAARRDPEAYRGWHVRANPVCGERLGRCPQGHCVDQLIIHHTAVLRDHTQPLRQRNEALKWVVHLVGDLHQPLHSGVNPNGGRARVELVGATPPADASLHAVWDGALLDAALAGWQPRTPAADTAALALDAPTGWMLETRDVALTQVYQPLNGFACGIRLAEPLRLDADYQRASVPVIRQQIERAARRLTQLLHQALAAQGAEALTDAAPPPPKN